MVSENQRWAACFLGAAWRGEAALPGSQRRVHAVGRGLLKWRDVKPCWEGPSVVKGTSSQIKIYLYSRKGFGQIVLCGRKGQHWLQMFRGALGKIIFNEPQGAFFEPGRVCYSKLSKLNLSIFTPVRSPVQQVLTACCSPEELNTCFNAFKATHFNFFPPSFCVPHTLVCACTRAAPSWAALRSQHSVPCSLCQPKPHHKPHQKLQGNIRRQNIRRRILPVKEQKMGFQRPGGVFSQQPLTASVSGEGSGLAEPHRPSLVGAAAPAEPCRKGSTRGDQPGLVRAVSWHLTWHLIWHLIWHFTWPHIQILALPAALLTSAIYSTGTAPIHMTKNGRRYHFVPLSMYAFHGRTGLFTACRSSSLRKHLSRPFDRDVLGKSCHVLAWVRKLYCILGAGAASWLNSLHWPAAFRKQDPHLVLWPSEHRVSEPGYTGN